MTVKVKYKRICLEASSICNLRCHSCPTASKAILPVVGNGFLRLHDFQKLLVENRWIEEIELSNYGEIFLNPDLLEIIKHAYERKVILTANNGVNLNNVERDVLEGLVKYKFRSMSCSIDGASSETYKRYRIRGHYDTVIENIKKINLFKKKYQSTYPLLSWQFVVFGYNEHELPIAKRLAYELNMDFHLKLSWDDKFSPVLNRELIRKELGVFSREEYKEKYGVDYMNCICHMLWEQPQINWDGKILGCNRNFWGEFGGNAFKDGLVDSLKNEKIEYARNMLTGKKDTRDDIPCATCSIYLHRKARSQYLNRSITVRALSFVSRKIELARYRQQLRKLFGSARSR